MVQLDLEDTNFLEDLAEELKRHDGTYDPEAEELENIILRSKNETNQNIQTVKFVCSKCGEDSWFRVDLVSYVITTDDLLCDDCNPVKEEDE